MTRINVVPVSELSDQWLLAEYRELPRVIKQDVNTQGAPERYKLGKGHVKWAKKHIFYTLDRYWYLCKEMKFRGFKVNYTWEDLHTYAERYEYMKEVYDLYNVRFEDIELNRQRLIEKYRMKPEFYKWTKRKKPKWLTLIKEGINVKKERNRSN